MGAETDSAYSSLITQWTQSVTVKGDIHGGRIEYQKFCLIGKLIDIGLRFKLTGFPGFPVKLDTDLNSAVDNDFENLLRKS